MIEIREGTWLKDHTTFNIGGPADYFVTVHSIDELREVCIFAQEKKLRVIPLGGGSNMLVSDEGIRGLVVEIALMGITYEQKGEFEVCAHVGGGVVWDQFVEDAVARGYWGIENLSAIPGTTGATPIQNVGAYGVEVANVIDSVKAVDVRTGEERVFTPTECAFGYRTSFFKSEEGKNYIIIEVAYTLTRVPTPRIHYKDLVRVFGDRVPTLREVRNAVIEIRSEKFPDITVIGTAGSFFKNPRVEASVYKALLERYPTMPGFVEADGRIKIPLGWILDKVLDLRGARSGAVGTYEGQSLVIVNYGGATAKEVDVFAEMIETKVKDATGIIINREVVMQF